jgi:hypothetical protein
MPIERSSFTECWVGFVFSSPGGRDVGEQRQVQKERLAPVELLPELPDRLEEGQALDVADRAADLHEHEVVALVPLQHEVLDGVRDVRDHLDRSRRGSPRAAPWR